MSKPVRLPDYLAAEVQRLADAENRSLANMVKVLLEQALKIEKAGFARIEEDGEPVGFVIPKETDAPDLHFKPDFKGEKR